MKHLFFPQIIRTKNYTVKACGGFYGYASYNEVIHADCQNRCVYCDVKLEENGHEGFALDHFRPQEHFPDLKNNPNNLVISCGKCNRNKSSHWPVGTNTAATHDGTVGFIDPFQCDRHQYFQVEPAGTLSPLQGPSTYLIKLLGLNRASRVLVRKHRILNAKINALISMAEESIDCALSLLEKGQETERALQKINSAKAAIASIKEIRNEIHPI
ncbi:HNH endonuclease [Metapseudomonas otitidis]|uniref:HNH endonuclease n=1 Tax=Metapseudomonas otitidis TaxID=319939 RepID=UPI0036705D54